jgi:Flp pilus assembly pilin Flp
MDMDTVDRTYSEKEGLLMAAMVRRLTHEERGQGLTEYAIIVATVALLVVGALSALGLKVSALFEGVQFPP